MMLSLNECDLLIFCPFLQQTLKEQHHCKGQMVCVAYNEMHYGDNSDWLSWKWVWLNMCPLVVTPSLLSP